MKQENPAVRLESPGFSRGEEVNRESARLPTYLPGPREDRVKLTVFVEQALRAELARRKRRNERTGGPVPPA